MTDTSDLVKRFNDMRERYGVGQMSVSDAGVLASVSDEITRLLAELSAAKDKLAKAVDYLEDIAGHDFEVLRAPNARHPAYQDDDATPLPIVRAYQEDAQTILAEIKGGEKNE